MGIAKVAIVLLFWALHLHTGFLWLPEGEVPFGKEEFWCLAEQLLSFPQASGRDIYGQLPF